MRRDFPGISFRPGPFPHAGPAATLVLAAVLAMPAKPGKAAEAATQTVRPGPPKSSVIADITLVAPDREALADTLIAGARALGGYFLVHDEHHVQAVVPEPKAESFLALAEGLGHVLDRSWNTRDWTQAWLDAQATLAAKEDLLEDYLEILKQAGAGSVFAVESAITDLRAEIEAAKGRLRKIEHDVEFARITVHFRFPERPELRSDVSSAFPWVNGLNLPGLLEDFRGKD